MSPVVASELALRFERELERPVELVLTRNRTRLVTWRSDPSGGLRLRLHQVFADLAPEELTTVADLVRERPGARVAMRQLIHSRSGALSQDLAGRAPRLVARGRVHDLAEIRDELLPLHFADLKAPSIGWSGRPGRARRRLRLGSWDSRFGLVRIHRCLDRPEVPRFFVASVVNHELSHAVLGEPPVVGGRRRVHGPEFLALERRFADHERAQRWEREHRDLLFSLPP